MADALIALYDEFAPEYERTRVPRFRPFAKRLLQFYDTRPGSFVIDAGCGTGMIATMVAPRAGHSGRVLGVDASPAMLEIARHKAAGFGFDQCQFVVGDILHLDADESTADLVVCSFALWGKPEALFAEFYRVLKPGRVLLLQNWTAEQGEITRAYREQLRAFSTKTPNDMLLEVRTSFAKHREDWAKVASKEEYEGALRNAGFAKAVGQVMPSTAHFKDVDELIEFHDLSVPTRAELGAMDEGTRERFHEAAREVLMPYATERGVDQEWHALQVSAKK